MSARPGDLCGGCGAPVASCQCPDQDPPPRAGLKAPILGPGPATPGFAKAMAPGHGPQGRYQVVGVVANPTDRGVQFVYVQDDSFAIWARTVEWATAKTPPIVGPWHLIGRKE